MKKLCIATNNLHKREELSHLLIGTRFEIEQKFIAPNVIEDATTLEGNALKKARAMYKISNILTIADDTGLEVYYLNMEPGVFSARYAGENVSYEKNNKKLLSAMSGVPERRRFARFRSVIAIVGDDYEKTVEGITEGIIIEAPKGNFGFGYDPIFQPTSFNKTYAEMNLEEKNKISHRAKAFEKLIELLEQI